MPIHQEVHQEVKSPPPTTSRRTAWVIVIIMTALLVLALLGTIWGFMRQSRIIMAARAGSSATSRAGSSAAADAPAAMPASAAAVITLAPGARIVSATTDAGKLVLHVATPSGGEVEIIDLATGKQTGQIKTGLP